MDKYFLIGVIITSLIFGCATKQNDDETEEETRTYTVTISSSVVNWALLSDFAANDVYQVDILQITDNSVTLEFTTANFELREIELPIFRQDENQQWVSPFIIDRFPSDATNPNQPAFSISIDGCYLSYDEIDDRHFEYFDDVEGYAFGSKYIPVFETNEVGDPLLNPDFCRDEPPPIWPPGETPPVQPPPVVEVCDPILVVFSPINSANQYDPIVRVFNPDGSIRASFPLGVTGTGYISGLMPDDRLLYDIELNQGQGNYLSAVNNWPNDFILYLDDVRVIAENAQDIAGTQRFVTQLDECQEIQVDPATIVLQEISVLDWVCFEITYFPSFTEPPELIFDVYGPLPTSMNLLSNVKAELCYDDIPTGERLSLDAFNPCDHLVSAECVAADMIEDRSGLVPNAIIQLYTSEDDTRYQPTDLFGDDLTIEFETNGGQFVHETYQVVFEFITSESIQEPVFMVVGGVPYKMFETSTPGTWQAVVELPAGRYKGTPLFILNGDLHQAIEYNHTYGVLEVNDMIITSTIPYGDIGYDDLGFPFDIFYYEYFLFEIDSDGEVQDFGDGNLAHLVVVIPIN